MEKLFRGVIVPFSRRDQLEYTIRELSPDYVAVISSQELLEEAAFVIKLLKETTSFTVHYCIHNDLHDPKEAMERFDEAFTWLKGNGLKSDSIATDITGGLVPTRFGVNMGAIFHNVNTLYQYMDHREKDGSFEFVENTKRMIRLDNPLEKSGLLKVAYVGMMFNGRNYRAASVLLSDILSKIEGSDLIVLYEGLKKVSDGYAEWDRAEYRQASQLLGAAVKILENRFVNEKLRKQLAPVAQALHGNIEFLRSIDEKRLSIHMIADMLSNARRRIRDEERYDDGVARIYRTIEMAVQLLLVRSSVDYLNVNWSTIRREIKVNFAREKGVDERALPDKLGLWDGLVLLEGYNRELLENVFKDRDVLLKLLRSRNQSILAHGMKPISKSTAEDFLSYAENLVLNLVTVECGDRELLRKADHLTLDIEILAEARSHTSRL
jgi:CRISPR-associated protein (TIGR02710 family)